MCAKYDWVRAPPATASNGIQAVRPRILASRIVFLDDVAPSTVSNVVPGRSKL